MQRYLPAQHATCSVPASEVDKNLLLDVPDVALLQILAHLPLRSLFRVACVGRALRDLVMEGRWARDGTFRIQVSLSQPAGPSQSVQFSRDLSSVALQVTGLCVVVCRAVGPALEALHRNHHRHYIETSRPVPRIIMGEGG